MFRCYIPLYVKHVLSPQNEFGIPKISKSFEGVPNRDDDADDSVSIRRFQSRASVVRDKKLSVSVGGGKLQSADHQCGTEPLELANRENHTCSSTESKNAGGLSYFSAGIEVNIVIYLSSRNELIHTRRIYKCLRSHQCIAVYYSEQLGEIQKFPDVQPGFCAS